jgi:hypothetical protein
MAVGSLQDNRAHLFYKRPSLAEAQCPILRSLLMHRIAVKVKTTPHTDSMVLTSIVEVKKKT